jgi:hypothetical protein
MYLIFVTQKLSLCIILVLLKRMDGLTSGFGVVLLFKGIATLAGVPAAG